MNQKTRQIRCTGCNALLAEVDDSGLVIRRGDLQATIDGDFHASVVCYRPRCRKLNVLRLSTAAMAARATA